MSRNCCALAETGQSRDRPRWVAPPMLSAADTPTIFISYMREDVDAARRVYDAIAGLGGDVWFDERRLSPGDAWEREILIPSTGLSVCSYRSSPRIPSMRKKATSSKNGMRRRIARVRSRAGASSCPWSSTTTRRQPEPLPADADVFRRLHFGRAPGGEPDAELITMLTDEIRAMRRTSSMTAATTARQLDSENPWPGLESFQENAHDFFFGRDREAESLLDHLRDASITVLYGRSGLGKTSLLQAGLFPALREENFLPDVCAVGTSDRVRRHYRASYINPSTTRSRRMCPTRRCR